MRACAWRPNLRSFSNIFYNETKNRIELKIQYKRKLERMIVIGNERVFVNLHAKSLPWDEMLHLMGIHKRGAIRKRETVAISTCFVPSQPKKPEEWCLPKPSPWMGKLTWVTKTSTRRQLQTQATESRTPPTPSMPQQSGSETDVLNRLGKAPKF